MILAVILLINCIVGLGGGVLMPVLDAFWRQAQLDVPKIGKVKTEPKSQYLQKL